MEWGSIFRDLITLFVVIDPIGTVPIFIAVSSGIAIHHRKKVAGLSILIAALVLYFFLLFGQLIFEFLGLTLGAFQIAGGIILFLFALTMIFGTSKTEEELLQVPTKKSKTLGESAVFPLAMPSIASPGAIMAVIMLTDNHKHSLAEQAVVAVSLFAVLAFTFLLMLLASPIQKMIGITGASIISRVMGMILCTVAVDAFLNGFAMLDLIDPNI